MVTSGPSFDRYELRAVLGAGGYATVYRAYDRVLGREVALKLPHAQFTDDEQLQARFLAEARHAASLTHPNIVTIYDVAGEHGLAYFTMELVQGITLAKWASLGQHSLAEVMAICQQLASALDYLHGRRIVHRDIKAANVMLEPSGRVVLMDFGIARVLEEATFTRTTTLYGTAEAMAPEQVLGQRVGPATDVYAFGVLVYRLLTGERPFGGTLERMMYAHVHEPPPALRYFRPYLPEAVYEAVDAALEKDPARRPGSAGEFVRRLVAGSSDIDTVSTPSGGLPASQKAVDSPDTETSTPVGPQLPTESDAAGRSPGLRGVRQGRAVWVSLTVVMAAVVIVVYAAVGHPGLTSTSTRHHLVAGTLAAASPLAGGCVPDTTGRCLAATAATPAIPTIAGEWQFTNYTWFPVNKDNPIYPSGTTPVVIRLDQQGTDVTGEINRQLYPFPFSFKGYLIGTTLYATYTAGEATGTLLWTFTQDGTRFQGAFSTRAAAAPGNSDPLAGYNAGTSKGARTKGNLSSVNEATIFALDPQTNSDAVQAGDQFFVCYIVSSPGTVVLQSSEAADPTIFGRHVDDGLGNCVGPIAARGDAPVYSIRLLDDTGTVLAESSIPVPIKKR